MKLTKTKLKQIIKEELSYNEQWDLEDHLWQKFADAIAISLSKGLSADAVQQQFDKVL
jgi:hypothetical protein